jgi:hypothetical protein
MDTSDDWWSNGEPCEEDGISFCARCKTYVGYPRFVYITKGWSSAFHKELDCSGLVEGQAFVARRGGIPAEVVQVTIAEGHRNHEPCLVCFKK